MIRNNLVRRLYFLSIAAFLLALAPVATARTFALDNGGGTRAQESNNDERDEDESPKIRGDAERRISDMRSNAQKEVEQKRESRGKKAANDKKSKLECENRQKAINEKFVAVNKAAENYLNTLNTVFGAVQTYQGQKNLPLANYQELVAAATDKQAAAVPAVNLLKTAAQTIDCNKSDVVVKLSTVRDVIKDTRQALHEYRMAIKDIVFALSQAQQDTIGAPADTHARAGGDR